MSAWKTDAKAGEVCLYNFITYSEFLNSAFCSVAVQTWTVFLKTLFVQHFRSHSNSKDFLFHFIQNLHIFQTRWRNTKILYFSAEKFMRSGWAHVSYTYLSTNCHLGRDLDKHCVYDTGCTGCLCVIICNVSNGFR